MRYLLFFGVLTVGLFAAEAAATKAAPIDVAAMRPKAEAGDAKAQLEMGKAYYSGRGVKKDIDEATKWYRLASDQGDPDGQCSYAAILLSTGSKKNARLAVELFGKAAEKGHPRAMFSMGSLYYSGTGVGGVERDPFVGAQWYEKAAFSGSVSAQYNIGVLLASDAGPLKSNPVDGLAWLTIASESGDKSVIEARDNVSKEVKPAVRQAAQARVQEFKAEIERIKRARESLAR